MIIYRNPDSTFGNEYSQVKNFRRVLICINKMLHITKGFLKCEEKEYRFHFDLLEQQGFIVLVNPSQKYMAEGYMISPGKLLEVERLSKSEWKTALKSLCLDALTATLVLMMQQNG